MNVMAGGTTQCIEINTLFFESRVLANMPAVTTRTGFVLGFLRADRVGYSMHRMTGGAINITGVMYAAHKHDSLLSHAFVRVT